MRYLKVKEREWKKIKTHLFIEKHLSHHFTTSAAQAILERQLSTTRQEKYQKALFQDK